MFAQPEIKYTKWGNWRDMLQVFARSKVREPRRNRRRRPSAVWLTPALLAASFSAVAAGSEEDADFTDPRYTAGDVELTVERPEGTVDCIAIDQQPSLNHPALASHAARIETPPRVAEAAVADVGLRSPWRRPPGDSIEVSAPEALCPDGTVPIVRRTAAEIAESNRLASENFADRRQVGAMRDGSSDRHQYAAVRRNVDNFGAESDLNIWAPYTQRSSEFSLSQIWVERGTGNNLETVEAGWQKYRDLYGDWRSHLFIYFTPDNYGSGGCYNLDCSGFIQVDNRYVPGGTTFTPSTRGGSQYYARIAIVKAGQTGSWWLSVGGTWVGYWPRELFDSNGLRDKAATVTYGGEIINSDAGGTHTRTDMGSGRFAGNGFGQAAFQKRLHYVDLNMFQQRTTSTFNIVTDSSCYNLRRHSSSDDNWREYFYYGGSGYNTNCQ